MTLILVLLKNSAPNIV